MREHLPNNIIFEPRALEHDDDIKNDSNSSDDEEIVYSRRQSNESNVSEISESSDSSKSENLEIDELSNRLENELKVEQSEKPICEVENLTKNLENELKLADEKDVTERQPQRNNFGRNIRDNIAPYNLNLNLDQNVSSFQNLLSGGYYQENNEDLNYYVPVLNSDDLSDYFNQIENETQPQIPEPIFAVPKTSESFSVQNSPFSDLGYSSEIFSPKSSNSYDTDSSQPVASPADVSQLVDNIPRTVPHSSDDETKQKVVLEKVRNWIDSKLKAVKQHEWIEASNKTVEDLYRDLRNLFRKETRNTDRNFVKIYATISAILKQGDLKGFFQQNPQILSECMQKNNPLLLEYIVETMQNLGLCPENISVINNNIADIFNL